MRKLISIASLAALAAASPLSAKEAEKPAMLSPGQIVANAAPEEWTAVTASDLLIMDLGQDKKGKGRTVIIQLMPEPFSQGWVRNIRKLAKAHWYDGTAIVRVQDNYVTQWGDPDGGDEAKAKKLPEGLEEMTAREYSVSNLIAQKPHWTGFRKVTPAKKPIADNYAGGTRFWVGWPFAFSQFSEMQPIQIYEDAKTKDGKLVSLGKSRSPRPEENLRYWSVHCYGMVGVGRGLSPDTGTGAELYTVIGHAPRHLDRNIAVVGRIIEGMHHLSSLPRGFGPLGFYETPEERVPIQSIRLASELPEAEQPRFEYLSTEGESFAQYAHRRANREPPFFIKPAGGADICNIPVPVRRVKAE